MENPDISDNTSPITDLSFLKIYASDNTAMMKQFIKAFLEKTPVVIQQLEDQYAASDFHALSRTAHSLKPQLSYMGIKSANDIIIGIEELAKEEKNPESIHAYIDQLKNLLSTAYTELNGQLSNM